MLIRDNSFRARMKITRSHNCGCSFAFLSNNTCMVRCVYKTRFLLHCQMNKLLGSQLMSPVSQGLKSPCAYMHYIKRFFNEDSIHF